MLDLRFLGYFRVSFEISHLESCYITPKSCQLLFCGVVCFFAQRTTHLDFLAIPTYAVCIYLVMPFFIQTEVTTCYKAAESVISPHRTTPPDVTELLVIMETLHSEIAAEIELKMGCVDK